MRQKAGEEPGNEDMWLGRSLGTRLLIIHFLLCEHCLLIAVVILLWCTTSGDNTDDNFQHLFLVTGRNRDIRANLVKKFNHAQFSSISQQFGKYIAQS